MQEVKEELTEERNKRLALQVDAHAFSFFSFACIHTYLPTAYCHNIKKKLKLSHDNDCGIIAVFFRTGTSTCFDDEALIPTRTELAGCTM